MSDYILQAENLSVSYGDFIAVENASFKVARGSITTLIGANGAGKSTMLKALLGENKPRAGKVIFENEDITGMKPNVIVRKGLTMSPEGSCVFDEMTVRENLLMGCYQKRAAAKKEELFERVYSMFPILKEKDKQLSSYLSGGQRQMLAIARAIMADPKMIICDEISLGLAPVVIGEIYEKIAEINASGVTFLIVDQDVGRSLEHSDYSYVVVKGGIVMEGKSADLPVEEVKDAYFGINKYA
ncbi:MAG: ABC transporter ATP-binding protein [Firmicutes bacterium]|nr:ABC transporter ATP-binding protein [Clostridiales bacterium]MBQ9931681.1 ABC transporter ATP-binding protein [Bacillota bacterium]